MNAVLEAFKKFWVSVGNRFARFLRSVYRLFKGRGGSADDNRTIKPILVVDEHPVHDEVRVHFSQSVAEKSSESGKLKIQRRPTSGKALLSKVPEDLSSEESDDENVTVVELASSSNFYVPEPTNKKDDMKTVLDLSAQGLKVFTAPTSSTLTSLQLKLDNAIGNQSTDGFTQNVKQNIIELIQKFPDVSESDIEKAYNEMCREVPFFKNLARERIFQVFQENILQHKEMSAEDAFDTYLANFRTTPNHDKV